MKRLKLNTIFKKSTKKYVLYALGEILLIVVGILLALYINNRNINKQYENQIDNNLIRVFNELEKNIDISKKTIEQFRYKDSLIHLVMSDALKAEDYYENLDLPYLIINNDQNPLNQRAYDNLIALNVSDNNYKEELMSDLKELYAINGNIKARNENMSEFIKDISLPLLSKNIKSYGALTYRREIKKDALNYFLTSDEYKTYVAQYANYSTRMQLTANRLFYKKALNVYNKISKTYKLTNRHVFKFNAAVGAMYKGRYSHINVKDTLEVKIKNDSLFIRQHNKDTYLVPIKENQYFLEGKGQIRYFVSFFKTEKDISNHNMQLQILAEKLVFKKVETE